MPGITGCMSIWHVMAHFCVSGYTIAGFGLLQRLLMPSQRLTAVYHILWSISTGTSIQKLRIFAVPTARGIYNHGVLFIEVKIQ